MTAPAPLREVPSLDQLATDPERVTELPPHAALAMLTRCVTVQTALLGRLLAAGQIGSPDQRSSQPDPDRLLSPAEAATVFGVKSRWLLDHADQIPGVRRLSRKVIRFSERALRRHLSGMKA